jgi:hypothetical protein
MACGLPTIVTGSGPCLDFTNRELSYYINYVMESFRDKTVSGIETVGHPFWFRPDIGHLKELMRYVFEHQQEANERGIRSVSRIQKQQTWEHCVSIILDKLTNCRF